MLKVAIIGLGTVSPIHKQVIERDSRVVLQSVCDVDTQRKNDYPDVPFYTDIETMLKAEELDCVHICLPHYLHAEAMRLCAQYGVNIFTEKPVAMSYEEAKTLMALEETYGIKIGVCLQNRYNNTTKALKGLIEQGVYGKLLGCKGIVTWSRTDAYYQHAPWRGTMKEAGGGVMMNQTVHTLDLMQYIAGDIKSIAGRVDNFSLSDVEIEDTATAYIEFENGATGVFFGTVAYCTNDAVQMEFVCEKARLVMRDNKVFLYTEDEETCVVEDERLPGVKFYYGASHMIAIEAFYTALVEGTNDYISIQEAAESIKMIDKIVGSSKSDGIKL